MWTHDPSRTFTRDHIVPVWDGTAVCEDICYRKSAVKYHSIQLIRAQHPSLHFFPTFLNSRAMPLYDLDTAFKWKWLLAVRICAFTNQRTTRIRFQLWAAVNVADAWWIYECMCSFLPEAWQLIASYFRCQDRRRSKSTHSSQPHPRRVCGL